jgi:hypothetical protein
MKINIIKIALCIAVYAMMWTSCSKSGDSGGGGGGGGGGESSGQGGSMARFSIKEDVLYIVDNRTLKLFDVTIASQPNYMPTKDQRLDIGIETIFIMDTLLFIGSESGMYIYDVTNPEFPQKLSWTTHVRSCDPVVASGHYAYVTLNTEQTRCSRGMNELHVYDISNPSYPNLIKTIEMNTPRGLGVDGQKLFVCERGLKIFDISDPTSPRWIDDLSKIPEANDIDTYDVIPRDGILLLIGKDGLYQFDYTGEKIKFLSKIDVSHE